MKVRQIVLSAAKQLNLCPSGANLNGNDTQIMVGLLNDVLSQWSTDNTLNNRATMLDGSGKGKDHLVVGIPLDANGNVYDLSKLTEEEIEQLKADHPEIDVLAPRPYNIQSLYVSSGSNWLKCNETSLAQLPITTFPGETNIPQFFALEQSWPCCKIHFNRGFSGRFRLVYSVPFPKLEINDDVDIPPEYQRALHWELVLAGACYFGLVEQEATAKAMRDETMEVVNRNNSKSDPIDLDDAMWCTPLMDRTLTIMNLWR